MVSFLLESDDARALKNHLVNRGMHGGAIRVSEPRRESVDLLCVYFGVLLYHLMAVFLKPYKL
jgi:hypothetical protein